MTKLKENPALWRDFVPIAFHVDYWDHLGWRDRFAAKEWTARQQAYATRWSADSVYTPGFVIDGQELRSRDVPKKAQETIGNLRLNVSGSDAVVSFKPEKNDARGYEAYLVTLGCGLASDVAAGENRGRKLTHDFVVLSLQKMPLAASGTKTTFSIDTSCSDKPTAVAAWVTAIGDLNPLQATGGWLAAQK